MWERSRTVGCCLGAGGGGGSSFVLLQRNSAIKSMKLYPARRLPDAKLEEGSARLADRHLPIPHLPSWASDMTVVPLSRKTKSRVSLPRSGWSRTPGYHWGDDSTVENVYLACGEQPGADSQWHTRWRNTRKARTTKEERPEFCTNPRKAVASRHPSIAGVSPNKSNLSPSDSIHVDLSHSLSANISSRRTIYRLQSMCEHYGRWGSLAKAP